MSMNTIECEIFVYDKEDFETNVMLWFKYQDAKSIKEFIEEEISDNLRPYKTAVYRRILNYKNGKDWFISTRDLSQVEKEKERDELIAIWKLSVKSQKAFYETNYEVKPDKDDDEDEDRPDYLKGVDAWFYEALAGVETELEKGEINEQDFITRCNNMKRDKQKTEDLLSACICSVLGRQNKARIGGPDAPISDVFRIICMPCGFLN